VWEISRLVALLQNPSYTYEIAESHLVIEETNQKFPSYYDWNVALLHL